MSWAALTTGIVALINADTGSGGLRNASAPLITAIYSNFAPQGAAMPYVVLVQVSDVEEKAFATTSRAIEYGVQFSVWTSYDGGIDTAQAIVDRLRAVCDRTAPTVSGFSSSQLIRRGGTPTVEDEFFHHIEEYEALLSSS